MTNSTIRVGPLGLKGIVGIAGCVLGVVVVYFGFGVGIESPKKEASASANPTAIGHRQRPVRTMNLALGNMVFLAHDLGFSVRNGKEEATDESKIAARIENQLQGIRELFRGEVINNPTLAGSMTLQFNIAPSGEVRQLRELASRLNTADFKKSILDEVLNWSFAELVDETLTVACTLLFVHEGRDITTLVQWEKSLGNFGDRPALAPAKAKPVPAPQSRVVETAATAKPASESAEQKREPVGTPAGKEFRIKYPTALRKYPNFSSASLMTFTIGTKVSLISKQGDWLEVHSSNNGPAGFIRKEFVT